MTRMTRGITWREVGVLGLALGVAAGVGALTAYGIVRILAS